ncbi:MAG: hypothetical protein H6742_19860 [Alphaproteobacteria bacterium]|nr:hypothetical protein [Alphaproteobacteria bacterium]
MKPLRIHSPLTGVTRVLTLAAALAGCTGQGPTSADTDPLPVLPDRRPDAHERPAGDARPQRELSIALTGEVRGEIEPCGCPTLPYGGFRRRSNLLSQVPHTGPLFQLDAGELLVKGTSAFRRDQDARARLVLELSERVGVDAWVPGPSDLLALPLDQIISTARPPAISATWADTDGALVLPPSIVLERDGLRLGVVGISAPPPDDHGLTALDPVTAAHQAVDALPDDLDLVVLLGNVDADGANTLAREVDGIAAVLTTPGGQYEDPRVVDDVPVVEAPDRGRYVQILSTRLGADRDRALELRPRAETWRSLMTLRQLAADDPARAEEPALTKAEAELQDQATGRNLAWLESRPLGEDLDRPTPAVDDLLGAFQTEAVQQAAALAAAPPPPAEDGYATAAKCTTCHLDEFTRWTFTDHAQAWQSLVQRDAVKNVECVPCHTTGWARPGGMGGVDEADVRRFKAVQCESCHGPLRGHPSDARIEAEPITEQTCTGCHDPANSPDFDFESYLRRATCQGGAPEVHPL